MAAGQNVEQFVMELIAKVAPDVRKIYDDAIRMNERLRDTQTQTAESNANVARTVESLITSSVTLLEIGEKKRVSDAIGLINLRDFGSSLFIQGQQMRQFRMELEEGFFEFERLTQQITVLDDSLRGMRDSVAKVATDVAISLGVTREEAAAALRDVTALGLSFEEASEIVRVAAQGAAAGMGSIENAASLLVTTNRQFGFSMEDSVVTMAKLVKIANETSFNIDDMREALATAGPQAASLGFSLEETAVSMAIMRDAGLDASEAGTAMRNFLIRIQDPTSEASALLEELGIETTDEAGNFLDLITILDNVGAGMEGLTEAQRLQAQATLFEIRGQQLINIGRTRERDDITNLINETENLNDTQEASAFLSDKASIAFGTLGFQFNAAKARAAEMDNVIAEALIPSEIALMDVTTQLKAGFANLPEPMRNVFGAMFLMAESAQLVIGRFALIGANIITLVDKMPGMITQMKEMITAHKRLTHAAIGTGAALLAVGFAMSAMQAEDPGTRAMFSVLTGLSVGLAAVEWARAAAHGAANSALTLGLGAAAIAAGIIFIVSTIAAQQREAAPKVQPVQGSQFGAFIPAEPGVGRIFRVSEGVNPEIISPVPMMKETFREVIRETGGSNNLTINPTVQIAPFTKVSDEIMDVLLESMSSEVIKQLRKRGAIVR